MIQYSNLILAIDTSCDETSAAVVCGRRVLSNIISSQINIHKKYGGVFSLLAKRAHQERIDFVVKEAIARAKSEILNPCLAGRQAKSETNPNYQNPNFQNISNFEFRASNLPLQAVAVTYGPGLAMALEIGILKAKELSTTLNVPLIAVNHLEGHIYSTLAQSASAKATAAKEKEIMFPASPSASARPSRDGSQGGPALCLIVSGGHTELVLMENHGKYKVLGATLDDACGEALDKAAKILHLGYPGGPIIERLAEQTRIKNHELRIKNKYPLNQSLKEKSNLNFSYSGLKTQFLYLTQEIGEEEMGKNIKELAFSFQETSFEQLIRKTSNAIKIYQPKTLLCGGGVIANKHLRKLLRALAKKENIPVFFPPNKKLITDNAAMIGIAASYKFERKEFVKNINSLERVPRLSL